MPVILSLNMSSLFFFQSGWGMFRGFVTCKDAQGCDGLGDKWASAGRAANFCKTSPPANEEHESLF